MFSEPEQSTLWFGIAVETLLNEQVSPQAAGQSDMCISKSSTQNPPARPGRVSWHTSVRRQTQQTVSSRDAVWLFKLLRPDLLVSQHAR